MKESYIPDELPCIEICTDIGCPLNCVYCPQKLFVDRYIKLFGTENHTMTLETFKTILKKVKKGGGVSFSGMVEPFKNPDCAEMIRFAADNGYRISLFTTLMGATVDDIKKIESINFSAVTLHIPDEERNSKFAIDDSYFETLEYFQKKINIDYYSCHGTVSTQIHNKLIKDKFIASKMANRAGNLKNEGLVSCDKYSVTPLVCNSGSVLKHYGHTFVVLPNGTLLLCCMDYGLQHIVGNLVEDSVEQILGGSEINRVSKGMLYSAERVLCHSCSSAKCGKDVDLLYFDDAVNVGNVLKMISEERKSYEELLDIYGPRRAYIFDRLIHSENIVIWGLGRLFQENFFDSKWCDVIHAKYFVDGMQEKWGKSISGVECKSPDEIDIEKSTVITYVKDDSDIRKKYDVNNSFINVFEIFNILK